MSLQWFTLITRLQEQIEQLSDVNKVAVIDEIELKSEREVNYTQLRDLLAAEKWREADKETAKVMCQAAGRESEGWLRIEDIDDFPCEDLRTINQLWLHYSKGKFGTILINISSDFFTTRNAGP